MTQEEKELLLNDLPARIRYGVKVSFDGDAGIPRELTSYDVYGGSFFCAGSFTGLKVDKIKPYLRPMSSMTEEEKYEFNSYYNMFNNNPVGLIDWLNTHHFDYRGLIKKGLAIAVTKENNPYEK